MELNKVYNEDGLVGMHRIPDKSIDMILCDLPFEQTARNHWDIKIDTVKLWLCYERIIKDNGAIVLFANGMFTAELMLSNKKLWRYNLVWDKVLASGHLNSKRMQMRRHEDICVFYKKQPTYNPQLIKGNPSHSVGKAEGISQEVHSRNTNYGKFIKVQTDGDMKQPTSILTFQKPHPSTAIHPTQKPVLLCENLVNTYTNEGEVVLDNCMGSWTTAVACINTNRNWLGFEWSPVAPHDKYFNIGQERVAKHKPPLKAMPMNGASQPEVQKEQKIVKQIQQSLF